MPIKLLSAMMIISLLKRALGDLNVSDIIFYFIVKLALWFNMLEIEY